MTSLHKKTILIDNKYTRKKSISIKATRLGIRNNAMIDKTHEFPQKIQQSFINERGSVAKVSVGGKKLAFVGE